MPNEKMKLSADFPYLMPLEQIELLCSIVYLNGSAGGNGTETLRDVLRDVKKLYFGNYNQTETNYPCNMTGEEWLNVIDSILSDSYLSALKIVKSIDVTEQNTEYYKNILPGHRAVCFMDDNGGAFIIFRGTYGDYEWRDNADGMVLADTVQQLAARLFVSEIKEDASLAAKFITVAGHSKGGNKAQYSAVTAPAGYVDRCVSIDGQGFSEQFLRNYKSQILSKRNIIELAAERRDFINCLGFRISDASFYSGKNGDFEPGFPYGKPLPYFHCPNALRASDGKLGKKTGEGDISKVINRLTTYFYANDKYNPVEYDITVDIISLMMKSKETVPSEIAEALKNLTEVCIELIAKSRDFRDDITSFIYTETDVLLATVENLGNDLNLSDKNSPETGVKSIYIEKLKQEIIKNEVFRKNFISAFLHAVRLLNRMVKSDDPRINLLLKHFCGFIDEITEGFIKKAAGKITNEFSTIIKESWDSFIKNNITLRG